MQSNPIVVGGVLYATTPTLKVVAVDAATGRELWKFDPSGGAAPGARFRHRGVVVHARPRVRHLSQLALRAEHAGPDSRSRPSARTAASISAKASAVRRTS